MTSQLGAKVSIKSYSFKPRAAQGTYDQSRGLAMIDEVTNQVPSRANSDDQVFMIFTSMLLPTAQGGSQGYFLPYNGRNVVVIWGRYGANPLLPPNPVTLSIVVAHEFGHSLGYGHEDTPGCIMNPAPTVGESFLTCKQFPGAPVTAPADQAKKPPINISPVIPSQVAQKGACIIATTAFGSELAPPVAFLREFRDMRIRSSEEGRGFMTFFNPWYYSFSPFVANALNEHPSGKETTRVAIYPLIWVLGMAAEIHSELGDDLGLLVAGAFAGFAIGLIYLSLLAALLQATRLRTVPYGAIYSR